MKIKHYFLSLIVSLGLVAPVFSDATPIPSKSVELLNVSYDATREFYAEYNLLFAAHWKETTGQDIKIKQSNGGSAVQAHAVMDGLQADVVTLGLAYDIDAIAEKAHLLPMDWQKTFPNNSCPYTSTVVFLVKKGNPKQIHDWDDLIKEGVQVITPNPKTSGVARWNYLAAYGYALKKNGNDAEKATAFVKKLYANVPILDAGSRGATMTFVERNIGDVLLTWENEALLAGDQLGKNQFEIVFPSMSILTEPPVAVVEKIASQKGTLDAAKEYLNFLYSKNAQLIAAKHFFRPSDPAVAADFAKKFPKIPLFTIELFGGWAKAQKQHFDEGDVFDQITKK